MSEPENLLEKIKQKRKRTTVPQRIDPLIPQIEDKQKASAAEDLKVSNNSAAESNSLDKTIAQLKEELETYPPTVRRSAIVISQPIEKELKQFCDENKITMEVFLEAAWQVTKNSEILKAIVDEAQIRYRQRKEVGRIKRLITQLSNQNLKK